MVVIELRRTGEILGSYKMKRETLIPQIGRNTFKTNTVAVIAGYSLIPSEVVMIGRGRRQLRLEDICHTGTGPPFVSPAPHNEPVRGLRASPAGKLALSTPA